jgi:hypothetical protein
MTNPNETPAPVVNYSEADVEKIAAWGKELVAETKAIGRYKAKIEASRKRIAELQAEMLNAGTRQ